MEKTKEQNESRLNEIIENFIKQLEGEYKDFSAVISVNDGERTSSRVHGSTLDLINNVKCIEENEAYKNVKKVYQKLNEFKEVLELMEEN